MAGAGFKNLPSDCVAAIVATQLEQGDLDAAKLRIFKNVPSTWPSLPDSDSGLPALLQKERKRIRSAMDNAAKKSNAELADACALQLQKLAVWAIQWHASVQAKVAEEVCADLDTGEALIMQGLSKIKSGGSKVRHGLCIPAVAVVAPSEASTRAMPEVLGLL
jgi:hypothetical protein